MCSYENVMKAFNEKLEECHKKFDPNKQLIKDKSNYRDYHSSLMSNVVHPVLPNLEYAVALLYTKETKYKERGMFIISTVLELQDIDESSPTYGIWPRYLEEPLENMKAPDWNWADFVGKSLLHLLIDLRDSLPDTMIRRIEAALEHAVKSIIKRNMGPDYTNINLMGAYVTIKAGELLKNKMFFNYGKNRLKKELEYVRANGGITEYNSPDYIMIDIEEVGRILKYVIDSECRNMALELNDVIWKCIAFHFHPTTQQLSAPHSRCYENIKGEKFVSLIEMATQYELSLLENRKMSIKLLWPFITIVCPKKYYHYFEPIHQPRFIKEKFYRGIDTISEDEIRVNIEKNMPELESRTYMNPYFSLGSFVKYDLWNQRRPLMAYWGTAEKCTYLRLRCLHDDYDYCSALLSASQINNHIVGGIYFVKDHGDTHFILDSIKKGQLKAKSLSVRFEIGGYIDDIQLPANIEIGSSVIINSGQMSIQITPMYGVFENEPINIRVGKNDSTTWIDIILFEGEEKIIDFNQINQAAFLFGLSIFDGEICVNDNNIFYQYSIDEQSQSISGQLIGANEPASIEIPLKPSNYIEPPILGLKKKIKCGGFVYE